MRRFVTATVLLLLGVCSHAQFSDSITHHALFSAAGNLNRSNSATSYLLTNESRFSIRNKHTTLNSAASWLYGEQGSTLTNNDFSTTVDFNIYRDSSSLYYWGLANYTTSYSLRINNQLQTGLGLAYNVVNKPEAWLNLSDGILYETSSLKTKTGMSDRYHTYRNSFRLSYKFIVGGNLTFSGTNFFQQALGDASDYILRSGNSISFKMNKWISIGTTLNYNQFRRTGTENLLFTYGITAERYF